MAFLVSFLIQRRHALAVLTLLLGGLVGWGLTMTSIETGSRAILSEGDPYKEEVDEAREDFPPTTSVIFAFEAPDVFDLDVLLAVETLTNRFTEVEGAIAIGSLLNRRFNDADAERYGRDYLVPLLDDLEQADLDAIRAIALADEDLVKSQLSPAGDMTLASIKYKAPEDTQASRLAVAQSVFALRDELRETHPDVGIYVAGNVVFEYDGYEAQRKDRLLLFPLVIGVTLILLWYCLRSLSFSLCLLGIAFATIGLAVGTFGWLDVPFNQISSLGPLVVLVIAIAHGIHIVSIYAQGLHKGLARLDAMRESLAINLQPVTLATLTTAMGFLSLNYSSSPGIYGFGNIIAVGVIWAYLMTLMLLPTLILLLPTAKVAKPLGVRGFIETVTRLVHTRGSLLFWGSTGIIVVTLALLPLNRLDFNRYSFVDENSDFHHVITALAEKIGNDQSLVYSVDSGSYYGITDPAFLAQMDTLTTWLEAQPEASFVSSYTDYLRARNKSEHDDDDTYDVVPDDQLVVIDYLVGYQLIQEIEPSLQPIFNADYSAVRLVVGTSNLSNHELLRFNDRIDAWLADNLPDEYRVLHGDNSILFARLDRTLTVELMQGFTVSFILITLTMLVGLRSVRYGLLSIMPNVFPATIVFGVWGLFIGELSPYILMLFSISIGLVVDDSVHILSKYISARNNDYPPDAAVTYSLDKAGSAITITTVALALGTVLLVFSNTFHFQNVALLLTPIIVVAWLLDLLWLPPLLIRFDRWLHRRPAAAPTPVASAGG